jgi:hypothetical protein
MSVDIVVSKKGAPPFEVEIVVFEEDTFRLLSASNVVRETRQDAQEMITDMARFEPAMPGELIVKGNHGYAIVHDLDRDPSSKPEWIDSSVNALLSHCSTTGIRSVAIEPLGCVHGKARVADFVTRLQVLASGSGVERIWVVTR